MIVKHSKINNVCTFQKTQPEKIESGEKEAKRIEELYENFQKEQLRNKYLQDEVNWDSHKPPFSGEKVVPMCD